ncbi:MAG TPA: nucleotidyltransferase domain-containing protein [Vicinamibacteria bacterium]|nr:nucleotidyltransferase domain-containing protein [Vicinamibacteria bacterium]
MSGAREVVEQARRLLEEFPEIGVAVLFGSRATGKARPDSDLDLAVLPVEGDVSRRRLQSRVAVALADLAPQGRVDVVFIDEAPELLRHRIMETGIVLLLKDGQAWRTWRIRTMREHGDREPVRRLFRRRQKERLAGGASFGRSGRALESLERVGKLPR